MIDQAPGNPLRNQIGAGVSPEQLLAAVEHSGYPLQTVVACALRHDFGVQEEWSFIDRDSGELRAMDLRADMGLFEPQSQVRVRPHLTLLVECKQSQLPYIFFEAEAPCELLDHPKIFGLHQPTIEIRTDDDASTWVSTVIHALDLQEHGFQRAPRCCRTFGKCVRKGSNLELSGADAYSGLILPLIKSLQHLAISEAPPETAIYFDARLSLGLGVIDGPMIMARPDAATSRLELIPWVRVLRHEYESEARGSQGNRLWAVDVVHRDFVDTYLHSNLIPFAKAFATRVLAHPLEIATGQAFASGMGANSWRDVEKRLAPRKTPHRKKP